MKKRFFSICVIILILLIIIFFICFAYKKIKFGNNKSNKSAEEIKEYILNINSYTAELEVTINNKKNESKYVLKQELNIGNITRQTVLYPENIQGVEIVYQDGNMIISNSKFNLSKVYNNYPYLAENFLWLSSFVDKYRECKNEANIHEENNEIIIELNSKDNKYMTHRKLYLEKGTGKPKKMEIYDDNKNNTVYILYKEININK